MIVYKTPIMPALKAAGYSSARLRREKIIGERVLTRIRAGYLPSAAVLSTLCRLLDCQPGDLIAYVPDDAPDAEQAPPADDPDA